MRVLIIEDSREAIAVAKARLTKEALDILCADGGAAGLELARREKPDLILLDLLLPKLNGYEVCNAVKRDNNTRHIPILVISTMDSPESIEKVKTCGAKNFMKKPYNLEDLLREIKRLLPAA